MTTKPQSEPARSQGTPTEPDVVKAQEWLIGHLANTLLALKAQEFAREREAQDARDDALGYQ